MSWQLRRHIDWGLRDYSLPPVLWGGDAGCAHVWGKERFKSTNAPRDHDGANFGDTRGQEPYRKGVTLNASQGTFCQLCGCWRGSLGLEPRMEMYVANLVEVFREVKRVLRDNGTLWLVLGDSYASQGGYRDYGSHDGKVGRSFNSGMRGSGDGLKPKDMVGIPWRVAFALQADGWYLRSAIIWHKPNCMPESVTDRPTTDYEHVFLLAKSKRYFYDSDAIREPHKPYDFVSSRNDGDTKGAPIAPFSGQTQTLFSNRGRAEKATQYHPAGRNRRTVWTISTKSFAGAHFATFPPALVEPMVKAGTSEKGCCDARIKKLKVRRDLTLQEQQNVYRYLKQKRLI